MEHGLTRFKQGYGFGTKKFGVSSIAKCVKNGVECNKRCVGLERTNNCLRFLYLYIVIAYSKLDPANSGLQLKITNNSRQVVR